MNNFWKPRKINIVDLVIFIPLMICVVILFSAVSTSSNSNVDELTDVNQRIIELQDQMQMLNGGGNEADLLQSEFNLGMMDTVEKGYTSNLERIQTLETTVGTMSGVILKINDWTVDADIRFNTLIDALTNGY